MSNPIDQVINADLRGSWPALLRAAQRARELAAQTGTELIVGRNGVIERINPLSGNNAPVAQEPAALCEGKP
jgi:hypothetical protein